MPSAPGFAEKIPHHDIIIETGTHKGTGSTLFLAGLKPKKLITMEVNYSFWVEAVNNLKDYPFITPLWGLSLPRPMAIEAIQNNPDLFDEDLTQDSTNPVQFYLEEIGQAGIDDLLGQYLPLYKHSNPLILLDSAGGVGYAEFLYVLEIMGDAPFTLILDDTNHVKHHRSREHLLALTDVQVLYDNLDSGGIMMIKKGA